MKATLITGASSGIGEGFARRLATEGHDLVLVARSEKALHELCDELMLKHDIWAHYIVLDLAEPNADLTLFAETQKHNIEIDCLINNAGFGSSGDFAKLNIDRELQMIELNIAALVAITHAYLKPMRERKSGTIVNVSSAAGFQPIPFMATYAATKAFVTSFSEAVAEENRPYGIQVLALCPGSTQTNFFAASRIDRPVQVKGQQTVEQVVETAIRAMKSGRTKVVSGIANKIGALLGSYIPSFITRRAMASALRPRFQREKRTR
ncbi:MAG TPA: SDR family oxidoreductase [Pyrinomonadaceae bacterium]|nr:SDR family oxidoreductase [Acidobacteriota bacterium]HQZ95945.1 SDR family oxidoreductase [Pyrinomonadaceae bacterium]